MKAQRRSDDDQRRADLAKIHILASKCGLDEDGRREMYRGRTGKDSAADMTSAERWSVIRHLRQAAGEDTRQAPRRKGIYPGRPKDMRDPVLKKIEAFLAEAGRPWDYADGMARHMFKIDKVQWLDEDKLRRLMLALKYDARRHGRHDPPSSQAWK